MAYNGYITPSTTITLYSNCPLPSNYEHTFYFSSLSTQTSYFNGLNKTLYANNTYNVISAGVIRIGDTINNVFNKSYMSFINANSNFENKTFYCFITDVVYINNNCTEIHYAIDVMQTYLFEYATLLGGVLVLHKKQFVDKTHIPLSEDVLSNGVMLNDEGLDTGIDMVSEVKRLKMPVLTNVLSVNNERGYVAFVFTSGQIVNVSNVSGEIPNNLMPTEVTITNPYDQETQTTTASFNTIAVKTPSNYTYYYSSYPLTDNYAGLQKDKYVISPLYCKEIPIYKVDGSYATNDASGDNFSGIEGLYNYIRLFNALGKIDAVQKIMLLPGWMCYKSPSYNNRLKDDSLQEIIEQITFDTTMGSYTPKNKKLLGYPYNYYVLDNNSTEGKVYKPQLFDNPETNKINFKFFGSVHYGKAWCYPLYYYTKTTDLQEKCIPYGLEKIVGIEIPYVNDSYRNWLANSTISRNIAMASHAVGSVLSIAGDVIGGEGSGKLTTKQMYTDKYANWGLRRAFAADEGREFNERAPLHKYKYRIGNTSGLISDAVDATTKAIGKTYDFVSSLAAQNAEHKEVPNTMSGSFDENMGFIIDCVGFNLTRVRVSDYIAQRIDHYFSAYGYKINDWREVKLKVRDNWTFVKTAGCAIEPDHIPTMFEEQINSIFDNGITFWSNTSRFMNYGDWTNN